jgi:hypothetical protein
MFEFASISSIAPADVSAAYITRRPGEFQGPPSIAAPSPSKIS